MADRLRDVIANARANKHCITVPGCHDAMSAVLIQRAGFEIAFMSGFAVSATQLAMPDAGLISYAEMLTIGKNICDATHGKLLVIGDGDTGFGGPGNIRRTLRGYAAAGFAGISIEDQVYPKRCSYAKGLAVEPRPVALARVRAAVEAIREMRQEGLDLLLIARTDCRNAAEHGGLAEAIARCSELQRQTNSLFVFEALGADMVYAEGLGSLDEMEALAKAVRVPTMLAQVERPGQALISAQEAAAAGFTLNLLGLTVLNVAMFAMKSALGELATGRHPASETRMPFAELYAETGFDEHYRWEDRFQSKM